MVRVPSLAGGSYCIDSTEVTNDDYAAFLTAKGADTSGQPAVCGFNGDYTPSSDWPAPSMGNLPVRWIDWCDARAYCEWAGKRLCGRIGGGPLVRNNNETNAGMSQWFNACSASGTRTYPYPGVYVGSACNGVDFGSGTAIDVGQSAACEGGFPGIFDMSGNVSEWLDSCSGTAGASDVCNLIGGSSAVGSTALACGSLTSGARSQQAPTFGLRCCAP